MRAKATFLSAALLALTGGVASFAATTPDPVITAEQVRTGKAAYQRNCALCHGANLRGGAAPAVAGPEVMARYETVAGLYDYLSRAMPPQAPGMLDEKDYVDIVAYMLAESGAQVGDTPLTADGAANAAISLVAVTAAGAATQPEETPQPGVASADAEPVPQAFTWGKELPHAEEQSLPTPPKPPANTYDREYTPVTDAMLANPPDGDWLTWRRTQDNQGYSPLDQINKSNVAKLELAWAWPTPGTDHQQAGPLMHDGLLFLSASHNVVQALDARTGNLVWEYRPVLMEDAPDRFYVGYQARRQKNSIALYEGAVVLTTADARIIVLDAKTGEVLREKQVLDHNKGYGYTSGPLVVNGKIISGISGCSATGTAGGCYIMAHDFETLEELWRINTIDDPSNPAQEASWGDVPPENRWGSTPWITGAYDPRTNLTFWGTGAPGPYMELIRGSGKGAALYANSTLAIDADTGKIRWYYQHLPRDNWDLDSPFDRVLVDMEDSGKTRHLLVTVAGKNGILFVLDRDTGKYLWSQDTVYQNVVTAIDKDGTVHVNEALIPTKLGQPVHVCPSVIGGRMWQATSYSPLTKRLFTSATQACNTVAPTQVEFTAGNAVSSLRFGPRVLPEGIDTAGLVDAISIGVDGPSDKGWSHHQRTPPTSSMLATAGGIVFSGDAARNITAWDQESGEKLWQQRLNAPIGGSPISYELDGEQYLVVPTGYSSSAASIASAFPEVPLPSGSGNSIFVFKLPKD